MTWVTGTDQVLLLLRERLSRGGATSDTPRSGALARRERAPVTRLRAMAGFDALDPDARRRAVVQGLLIEELGEAVANDAGFQAILGDVMRIIGEMPGGPDLIDRAATALRGR